MPSYPSAFARNVLGNRSSNTSLLQTRYDPTHDAFASRFFFCQQLHPSEMSGSAIKIALNGSIGLEVTPPEEVSSPGVSSNMSAVTVPSLFHQPPPSPLQQMSSSSPVPSPHSSQEHLQGTIV